MRNLKRVLSLALALVMVLGMMVITTSAAAYTDADEITYTEAVDVMSALGVFKGDNGALKPTEILTREEAATVLARIHSKGAVEKLVATKQIFTDVAADWWSAKYVEYCYNTGLIDGLGNGKFDPQGELTGIAFAKLILVAMGYDADAQGYVGKDWATSIAVDALNAGLYIANVDITAALTREAAAQMLFQALGEQTVSYTTVFDKATAAPVLVFKGATGTTFAQKYFNGLTKVAGTISSVDYYYGSTTFYSANKFAFNGKTTLEVRKAGADFKNIGYAAYVWALPGGAENSYYLTAISDVIITGTSMGVNTNGADIDTLTDSYASDYIGFIDEKGCSVYYNGKYVDDITLDRNYDVVADADTKAVLAKADKVGVKVEFIDNDNQGKAEAIVITEYTFDYVKSIKKVSKSGEVSIKHYELGEGTEIKPAKLVGPEALAAGDFVTYVAYNGYYLTNVLEVAEGEFEEIERNKLNNETVRVYYIDGEGYLKSDLSSAHDYLANSNVNEDVVYVLDQYGYVVYAGEPAADPDSYVFVLDNEDSHGIKNLAETELAFVDGTVDIVDSAWKYDIEDGELADEIYTYVEKNGVYTLKAANAQVFEGDYETKTLKMGTVALSLNTVVVDLRDYLAGDADEGTVYVGYKKIPSFVDGTVYYLEGARGMALAFLVDGDDPATIANLSASFVVFNTDTNRLDKVKGSYTYELDAGVLVKGEVEYDYVLTQTQKDAIDALGVGVYEFNKDGSLKSYTSFAEDDVIWTPESSGSLIKNNKDITDDYTPVFLNIADGEVNDWYEDVDSGEYYAYFDEKNDIVYIVADKEMGNDLIVYLAKDADAIVVMGENTYYSAEGLVTRVIERDLAATLDVLSGYTVLVFIDGEFVAVEAAVATAPATDAELAAAIADSTVDTVVLPAGDFTVDMYNIAAKDTLTIIGDGTTKIAFENLQVRASQFDELIIENCVIERMPNKAWGHLVFGSSTTAGGVYTIRNCTFNGEGSQGIYINQDVAATFNIENCTFNGDFGSEGAITIQNNDGVDITVNVTDCTFNNIPATSHEIYVLYEYAGWTLNAKGVDAYWAK